MPVAQLDRASASGAEGYRFDPCRAYHSILLLLYRLCFYKNTLASMLAGFLAGVARRCCKPRVGITAAFRRRQAARPAFHPFAVPRAVVKFPRGRGRRRPAALHAHQGVPLPGCILVSHPPAVHLVGLDVALDVAQDVPLVRRVEKIGRIFGIYGAACFFHCLRIYASARRGGGGRKQKKGYLIFVTCDGRF